MANKILSKNGVNIFSKIDGLVRVDFTTIDPITTDWNKTEFIINESGNILINPQHNIYDKILNEFILKYNAPIEHLFKYFTDKLNEVDISKLENEIVINRLALSPDINYDSNFSSFVTSQRNFLSYLQENNININHVVITPSFLNFEEKYILSSFTLFSYSFEDLSNVPIIVDDRLRIIYEYEKYALREAAKKLHEMSRINSLKAAIAAIMARNMSHNLGSHVFYYVRDEFSKLADEGEKDDPIVSKYKGLSKFLQYVQERQDFVATITSQDEYFMGPLNLKLDVLDELTPDAVDFRHNSEPPSTNYILKYLVNSEGIERKAPKDNIFNANKEIEIEIDYNNYQFKSKDNNGVAVEFYDINLAVQGGQQSRHAFLIIIENIIRNAAKHGFDKGSLDLLKINIKVKKINQEFIISITDNCGNGLLAGKKINDQLSRLKILGDVGSQPIDRENKGLKEIIVCTAWLKKIPLSEVFKPNSGITDNLLEIYNVEDNLCYEFSLPVFNATEEIDYLDIDSIYAKPSSFRKYASIYRSSAELLSRGLMHFPRCIDSGFVSDIDCWRELAKRRMDREDTEHFPVIVFERSENDKATSDKFRFIKDEGQLKKLIPNLMGQDYILFKNHLAKNDKSISQFYSQEVELMGHKPIITESLSGANYSFNLFQIAQINDKQPELYYHIIEAYFTRIVIIDERLCPVEVSFEEDLLNLSTETIDTFVYKYINDSNETKISELKAIIDDNIEYKEQLLLDWWGRVPQHARCNVGSSLSNSSDRVKYMENKNIHLYTMDKTGEIYDGNGNQYNTLPGINPHFLSIHISLLEKLAKFKNCPNSSTKDKLIWVLNTLQIPESTYVAVHSGRGGLTDSSRDVAFIPFANLQWAFENSKYMLSELFHSQIYFPIQ